MNKMLAYLGPGEFIDDLIWAFLPAFVLGSILVYRMIVRGAE